MKKCILIILLSSTISCFVQAQQVTQRTQFHLNRFIFNPAVAGTSDDIPLLVNVRKQWVGIDDAPTTQSFSAHAFTGKGMGLGMTFFNDIAGPSRNTGFSFAAARHFRLTPERQKEHTWLSVGASAMFYQYFFDVNKLTTDEPDDQAILRLEGQNSRLYSDITFGAYINNKVWFLGFSAANLLESQYDIFSFDLNPNTLQRTYYLIAGYKYMVNDLIGIQPVTLLRGTEAGIFQADIMVKGYYQNHWLGFSYRTSDAISALVGFSFQKSIQFSYSYDITVSDLDTYNNGTHEFTAIFYLFDPINREGKREKEKEERKKKKRKNRFR